MQKRAWVLDDEGLLSIDFLAGFTIFILAFIFVSLMMSGLLINLQSKTIDYDAVAYRTGVVLAEDPGEPKDWHLKDLKFPSERAEILRMGLSVDRYSPGILSEKKVEKFFTYASSSSCSAMDTFCYPNDYRDKLIFGDYPYNFNITLRGIKTSEIDQDLGPVPPNRHGYIRRIVKIKEPGTINFTANTSGTYNDITVHFNFGDLYEREPLYRLEPLTEDTIINLTDFGVASELQVIRACTFPTLGTRTCFPLYSNSPTVWADNNNELKQPIPEDHFQIIDNMSVIIEDGFFGRLGLDEYSEFELVLTFTGTVTNQSMYTVTYDNITFSEPIPAAMEVRIW